MDNKTMLEGILWDLKVMGELTLHGTIESSTPEAVTNANAAREALIAQMDTELIVEGLIKGLGYNDCVITMTSSNVNVLVDAATLTDSEVAQIVSIIQENLNLDLKNIKIIPVD